MGKKPKQHLCSECNKMRERCRAASVDEHGNIIYVCRQCWNQKGYDMNLYEYRLGKD